MPSIFWQAPAAWAMAAGVVLAVVSGLLVAGGAVFLWMRSVRNLVGD